MELPKQYQFLNEIGTLPKLVENSLKYYGTKEFAGTDKNNPVIMNMAKEIGIGDIYKNDEIAWCAVYHAFLCKLSGKPVSFKDPYDYIRAKSFATWGNHVDKEDVRLGDTLVFVRPGGNHVGLYIGENENNYFVLGGNQSDSVNIVQISKNRLLEARNLYSIAAPESAKKYILSSSGPVSQNES